MDSRSAAGGMGLCVLGAPPSADAGGGAEAARSRAPRRRARTLKMWFAIDTLEYLRRGGRIGGARAWIGGALKIKPILTLEEEITPVERVRTRARSLERLRDYARQRHESGADGWVVQHIQDDETADALIDDCREIFGCEPVFISEIGAVLGAHVGPGLLGVGSVLSRARSHRVAAGASSGGGAASTRHADREARPRRRRSISSLLVLLDLAAPVGQLVDAAAQRFDRAAELLALQRRCRGGSRPPSGRARRPSEGSPALGRCSFRLLFEHLLGQLRLFDRLLGHRRRAGLDARGRR